MRCPGTRCEAVEGVLVKNHLGNAWQVAGHVGEPCFRQHQQVVVGAWWARFVGLYIEHGGVAAEPVRPEAWLLLKHVGVPARPVKQFHLAVDLLDAADGVVCIGVADKKQRRDVMFWRQSGFIFSSKLGGGSTGLKGCRSSHAVSNPGVNQCLATFDLEGVSQAR